MIGQFCQFTYCSSNIFIGHYPSLSACSTQYTYTSSLLNVKHASVLGQHFVGYLCIVYCSFSRSSQRIIFSSNLMLCYVWTTDGTKTSFSCLLLCRNFHTQMKNKICTQPQLNFKILARNPPCELQWSFGC